MKKILALLLLSCVTALADPTNWILDSSNNNLSLSNFRGKTSGVDNLSGLPLGVSSGELGLKVVVVNPGGAVGAGGDASAANQTATLSNPGSDATKATAVQGVTGMKPVVVSGTVTASGPLTDTQLRATAVPVSGTFFQTTQPVSLATAPTTPVTGTFWQATQPVSGTITATGPLTDTQLRATAVPVDIGDVTLTPTAVAHTTSGTVASGCYQVTFIASGGFNGTILTNFPLLSGAGLVITPPAGKKIGAVAYTVSAGTLYSIELR